MGVEIAKRWFERRVVDDAITLLWEPHVDPLIRCNIWHVRGRDRDLMIDTGLGLASLREASRDLLGRPVVAVATHWHFDHTGGLHEFETRVGHRSEAALLAEPPREASTLRGSDFPDELRSAFAESGYELPDDLLDASPRAGFDPDAYEVRPAPATRLVDEGDVVDTGDRSFEVLHLPGHSPGSIGLFEAATGTFFSGDAVYDGPLLDMLPDANVPDYCRTMERLRELPVRVVHAGHEPSFGRERLIELCDAYLTSRSAR